MPDRISISSVWLSLIGLGRLFFWILSLSALIVHSFCLKKSAHFSTKNHIASPIFSSIQWPKVFADVNRVLVHPLSLIDVLNRFPFRSRRCCGIWTFSGAVFVNWAAMPVSANPASSAPLRWDQKIRTRHCLFPFTLQLDSSNALQWHFYSFHFNRKRNTKWKIKVNQVPPVSQSFPTRWPPPFHNESVTSRQAVHGNFPFFFFCPCHFKMKAMKWEAEHSSDSTRRPCHELLSNHFRFYCVWFDSRWNIRS